MQTDLLEKILQPAQDGFLPGEYVVIRRGLPYPWPCDSLEFDASYDLKRQLNFVRRFLEERLGRDGVELFLIPGTAKIEPQGDEAEVSIYVQIRHDDFIPNAKMPRLPNFHELCDPGHWDHWGLT